MQALGLPRPLVGVAGIVAIGTLVGLVAVLAVTYGGPVKLVFAFGGLVLLLPAFVVRDPRAYGLFLLTFSVAIEIYQHTTNWLADPYVLFQEYGLPSTGTLGVDLYVADFLLIIMLLPWLAEICRRQRRFYFPKIGYIFLVYLAWALLVSLIEAQSFYLAIFEWSREVLYFVFFLYIVNNVVTPAQFRAVVMALLVGLVLESVAVIGLFQLNMGTAFVDFQKTLIGGSGKMDQSGTLPVAESGSWSTVKRSTGTFAHPAITAYYLGYILPIALGYLAAVRRRWDRILFGGIFVAGCLAFALTFSRSGVLGLIGSFAVFVPLAGWTGLISRRTFAWCVFIVAMAAALSTPLLISFLESRPEALGARFELISRAEATYWRHPILGAGLNNSTAATVGSHQSISTPTGAALLVTVVHNHYLIVLIEVGAIGFVLFFGFFVGAVATALHWMRAATTEMKLLLIGLVSALLGVAIHNFGDPFGGHMTFAMLWLNVGLIFAVCRRVQAEAASRSPPLTPVS
jgi:O-antigen ligase